MINTFKKIIDDPIRSNRFIFVLLVIIAAVISIQNILLGVHSFWGGEFTHYNNYIIFKNSYYHLISNKNLYSFYLHEHADLFKYTPTFAFFMGLFAYLPDNIGLTLWNLLNILILYFAITSIKNIEQNHKLYIIFYILFEMIVSQQNSQSNCLLAGLMILSFNSFEKNKPAYATLFIMLGSFIKIFSIVGTLMLFLYPNKLKSILFLLFWFLIFGLAPLIVISPGELVEQYGNWFSLLVQDHSDSLGMSIYQYSSYIFSEQINKNVMLLIGCIILLSPLAFRKQFFNDKCRLFYFCLILLWVVVFNHKAESSSFVIAMAGCTIWIFSSPVNKIKLVWISLTLFLTSLISIIIAPSVLKTYIDLKFIKPLMPSLSLFVIYFYLIKNLIKNRVLLINNTDI